MQSQLDMDYSLNRGFAMAKVAENLVRTHQIPMFPLQRLEALPLIRRDPDPEIGIPSACYTERLSVSRVHPVFSAMDRMAT